MVASEGIRRGGILSGVVLPPMAEDTTQLTGLERQSHH